MEKANLIGFEQIKARQLAKKINKLLADYSMLHHNARAYQSDIKSKKFFELYLKFEELYNVLLLKVDDIAERILPLWPQPEPNDSEYFKISSFKESNKISEGIAAVEQILEAYKTVIIKQREILTLVGGASDEGTISMMSDYIRLHEKQEWIYSYLK